MSHQRFVRVSLQVLWLSPIQPSCKDCVLSNCYCCGNALIFGAQGIEIIVPSLVPAIHGLATCSVFIRSHESPSPHTKNIKYDPSSSTACGTPRYPECYHFHIPFTLCFGTSWRKSTYSTWTSSRAPDRAAQRKALRRARRQVLDTLSLNVLNSGTVTFAPTYPSLAHKLRATIANIPQRWGVQLDHILRHVEREIDILRAKQAAEGRSFPNYECQDQVRISVFDPLVPIRTACVFVVVAHENGANTTRMCLPDPHRETCFHPYTKEPRVSKVDDPCRSTLRYNITARSVSSSGFPRECIHGLRWNSHSPGPRVWALLVRTSERQKWCVDHRNAGDIEATHMS
ncbi:hypothetical protein EDB83DRAFT_2314848 [Lactarius deliciosus]|nr:hypothetical protein EDB83DRAFT_2314848 [Lactarius deliciosus]